MPLIRSGLDELANTPAVARRLSDRAVRAWEITWTIAVLAVLITCFVIGDASQYVLLSIIAVACAAASSALTVVLSRTDATLVMSIAPAILLVLLTGMSPATALALWGTGYFIGALVRIRHIGDAAEMTAYMIGAGLVTAPVWLWLSATFLPWPIAAVASVSTYMVFRLVVTAIRQSIVTDMDFMQTLRGIMISRAFAVCGALCVIAIGGMWLARATEVADADFGAPISVAVTLLVMGIGAFTVGILGELRLSATRLEGTLGAALALPWPDGVPVETHALGFARATLPQYAIELRATRGRNVNEMVSPLPEGYLVARRGLIQAPFLVEDQRVLDSIAHIAENMAEARRERENLARAATTDALTGLPNYRAFRESLTAAAQQAPRTGGFAVVYVDVDGFKEVNDRHGHEAGNAVLRTVAERMQSWIAQDGVVARVGGDEFAVILTAPASLAAAEQRAAELVGAVGAPVLFGSAVIVVGLSYGVAFSGPNASDVTEIVDAADARMYAARGRALGYGTEPANDTAPISVVRPGLDVVDLVATIADAVRENRLALVYQPIVDRVEDRIIAIEALIRPQEARLRGLTADLIVHEARRLGLLTTLSTHVVRTAIADMRRFQEIAPDLRDVHVNIDVEQVTDSDFVSMLLPAPWREGIVITLELNETSLHRSSDDTRTALEQLRTDAAIHVALDDFGRDSSTLLSIVETPFDVLKIDKELTRSVVDRKSRLVMRSLSNLARSLHVQMVVEGVEDDTMYEELVQVGVRYMQGYRFGQALHAEHLCARLAEHGLRAKID